MIRNSKTNRGQSTIGILSVVLICLTAALAAVYGQLSSNLPFGYVSSALETARVDKQGEPTAPAVSNRPLLVVDWRASKAAANQYDGKSKSIIAAAGAAIVSPVAQVVDHLPADKLQVAEPSHRYKARAPPMFS